MIVRDATPADAEAIARVQIAGWQAAYRDALPAEVLDGLDHAERSERWRANLVEHPIGSTLVAEDDGEVVAFIGYGPCRDDEDAGAGEIHALYAHPEAWGAGAGRALVVRALADLRAAGHDEAILWVLEQNPRGRAFYERGGWVHDGGRRAFERFGASAPILRYRLRLR